jgi:GlpG protein
MRQIGSLPRQQLAAKLEAYFERKQIEAKIEPQFQADSGQIVYEVWIRDEDQMEAAKEAFDRLVANPHDPDFEQVLPPGSANEETEMALPDPAGGIEALACRFTQFIVGLCTFLFLLNAVQEVPLRREKVPPDLLSITPIQTLLLYDVPAPIEAIQQILRDYPPGGRLDALPPSTQEELKEAASLPFFRGFYEAIVRKWNGEEPPPSAPTFIKIREGQIWRLFSPALLHQDLLHILFNMIWVWILCRPIEQRLGLFKTALMTLLIAAISNTAQYLMTGPLFLGYSGVVTGLAGFIWARQKEAPWEGYPIARGTLLFLAVFVIAIFGLQILSFLLQAATDLDFSPNIANTAHIVGALSGLMLGRLRFFAWRAHA